MTITKISLQCIRKEIVKTVTPLCACTKNWSPFSAVKNIIVYYNNSLLRTTKIVCENKVKGFGYSDNCKIVQKKSINIIFCAYNIWYLCARSIIRVISSARTSAIVLFSWQGLYKALPINKKFSQEMLGVVYLN